MKPLSATLKADPEHYSGKCSTKITFTGKITKSSPGKVYYHFINNLGVNTPVDTLPFESAGSKEVMYWWTNRTGNWSVPYSGWVAIKTVCPIGFFPCLQEQLIESNKAQFSVECLMPDLTVTLTGPSSAKPGDDISQLAKLVIKNIGTAVAPGGNGSNYPYDNVYSNFSLKPGEAFGCALQPTIDIPSGGSNVESLGYCALKIPQSTPPGEYKICAKADYTNVLPELNENNNESCFMIKINP